MHSDSVMYMESEEQNTEKMWIFYVQKYAVYKTFLTHKDLKIILLHDFFVCLRHSHKSMYMKREEQNTHKQWILHVKHYDFEKE